MARSAHPQRVQFWRKVLQRQKASGLSVAEFCRREGVSPPSFYQWRGKLAAPKDKAPPAAEPATSRFEPVLLRGLPPPLGIEIELPDGPVLRLPLDVPEHVLRDVLAAVAAASRLACAEAPRC